MPRQPWCSAGFCGPIELMFREFSNCFSGRIMGYHGHKLLVSIILFLCFCFVLFWVNLLGENTSLHYIEVRLPNKCCSLYFSFQKITIIDYRDKPWGHYFYSFMSFAVCHHKDSMLGTDRFQILMVIYEHQIYINIINIYVNKTYVCVIWYLAI